MYPGAVDKAEVAEKDSADSEVAADAEPVSVDKAEAEDLANSWKPL